MGGLQRMGDVLNRTNGGSHRMDFNPSCGKFCRLNVLQIVNLGEKERDEGEV